MCFILYKMDMKKVSILSLLWVVLFSMMLVGCSKSSSNTGVTNSNWAEVDNSGADPKVLYNDTLYNLAFSCKDLEATLRDTYDQTSNIEDIKSSVDNMLSKCSDVLKSIESVWDLEWDSSFKDWVKTVIEREIAYYTKLIDILPYIDKDELTEEENEIYEWIRAELEVLDRELTEADENLVRIQEDFAERHWFRLDGVEYIEDEGVNMEDEYVAEGSEAVEENGGDVAEEENLEVE